MPSGNYAPFFFLEDKESIGIYGVKEGEKNYSDIKPQRVGTVTALGKDVITFVDETMFDLNAKDKDGKSTKYLIAGTNAKIKFESGQLAGYEFDLHTYDHATHTFVINKFTDDNGMVSRQRKRQLSKFRRATSIASST